MYKVSVVVPVYNKEDYVGECLESILSQTLGDIEVLCINDGSTDGSLSVLNKFSETHRNVVVIDQPNRGVGASRNTGIDRASGVFIAFMDPDDLYPDKKVLEDLYTAAESSGLPIVGGSFSSFRPDGAEVSVFRGDNSGYTFSQDGPVDYADYQFDYGFQRFIYSRDFIIEHGLRFPNYIRFQDPPFFTAALSAAGRFYALSRVTYRYRESYKEVGWNVSSKCDMLRGLRDNLALSARLNLRELHSLTYRRLSSDFRAKIILSGNNRFTAGIVLSVIDECYLALMPEMPTASLDAISEKLKSQASIPEHEPVISVVVPVYNVENYLRECLDSLVNQKGLDDFEVIMVDDGATDSSGNICEEYADADPRFRTIHKTNGGLSSARNAGADYARGKYIYFLDSDDYLRDDALLRMVEEIGGNNLDLLCFDADTFFDTAEDEAANEGFKDYYSKRLDNHSVVPGKVLLEAFQAENAYRTPVQLLAMDRSFYTKNALSCYFGILHEDNLFTFQALLLADRAKYLDESLYFRRIRGGSIMTAKKSHRNLEGYRRCLLEMVDFMLTHPGCKSSAETTFEKTRKSAKYVWDKLGIMERASVAPLNVFEYMKTVRYGIPSPAPPSALMSVYVVPDGDDARNCIVSLSNQHCPVNCFVVGSDIGSENGCMRVEGYPAPVSLDRNRIFAVVNGRYCIDSDLLLDMAIDLKNNNECRGVVMKDGKTVVELCNRMNADAPVWDVSEKYSSRISVSSAYLETDSGTHILQPGSSLTAPIEERTSIPDSHSELLKKYWRSGTPESMSKLYSLASALYDKKEPTAMVYLGRMYRDGLGVPQNLSHSVRYFSEAYESGETWIGCELSDVLLLKGLDEDTRKAISILESMSISGDKDATFHLAQCYRDGIGIDPDPEKYWSYLKSAALGGHVRARNEYYDRLWEKSTPESLHELIDLATRCAADGDPRSMQFIGKAYRDGKGVQKDLIKASEWMGRAYGMKNYWVSEYINVLWSIGTDESLALMKSICDVESESGNPVALRGLARCYRDGKVVEKDIGKAISYMRAGQESGAEWMFTEYLNLISGNFSSITAEDYDVLSSHVGDGNPRVDVLLAICGLDGRFAEKDVERSMSALKSAIARDPGVSDMAFKSIWDLDDKGLFDRFVLLFDSDDQMVNAYMGKMYLTGKWVQKDAVKAREHYEMAPDVEWAVSDLIGILWNAGTSESIDRMLVIAQPLADRGHKNAIAHIAKAYRYGKGVDRNLPVAADLMRKIYRGNAGWTRDLADILDDIGTPEAISESKAIRAGKRNPMNGMTAKIPATYYGTDNARGPMKRSGIPCSGTLALFPDSLHAMPSSLFSEWVVIDSMVFTPAIYEVYDPETSHREIVQCFSESDYEIIEEWKEDGKHLHRVEASVNYPLVMDRYSKSLGELGNHILILDLWPSLLDISRSDVGLQRPDCDRALNFSIALYHLRRNTAFEVVSPPCEFACVSEDPFDYPDCCMDYLSRSIDSAIAGSSLDMSSTEAILEQMKGAFSDYTSNLSSDENGDLARLRESFLSSESDPKVTYELALALALIGNDGGSQILGRMYKQGYYVEMDEHLASFWLRRSAREPDSGLIYFEHAESLNLPEYMLDAVSVLEGLAGEDDYRIHFSIGKVYLQGSGVFRDPVVASKYFAEAYNRSVAGSGTCLLRSLWEAGSSEFHEELLRLCRGDGFKGSPEGDYYLGLLFGFDDNHKDPSSAEIHLKKAYDAGIRDALAQYLRLLWDERTSGSIKKILQLYDLHPEDDAAKGYYALALSDSMGGRSFSKSKSLLSELAGRDPFWSQYLTCDGYLTAYSEGLLSFDRKIVCPPSWAVRLSRYAGIRNYIIADRISELSPESYLVVEIGDLAWLEEMDPRFPNDRIVFVSDPLRLEREWKRAAFYRCQITHPGSSVAHDCSELMDILDRKISQHESKALSDFEVKTTRIDGTVCAEVILGQSLAEYEGRLAFTFRLYHDNQAVESESGRHSEAVFPVADDGIYNVQASVSLGQYTARLRSNSVSYFSEAFRKRVDSLLSAKPVSESMFVLFPQTKPFQDILIRIHENESETKGVQGLSKILDMVIDGIGTVEGYSSEFVRFGDVIQSFSGIRRFGNGIQVDGVADDSVCNDQYGCFTCLRADLERQTVTFFHDFCGFGKLFLYSDGHDSFISNRYSFLISVLRNNGKGLTFDREKVLAGLSSVNQVLLQNYSHRMDVPEIEQLDPCSEIIVSSEGLRVVKNKMYDILMKPRSSDISDYDKLLDESSEDIERNISCALDSFDIVHEDLSGGMDSRLVLSVANDMDVPPDTVKLNIRGPANSRDVEVGLKISSLSRFGFVSDKVKASFDQMARVAMLYRNHYLGQYYSYGLNRIHVAETVCKLTGGNGDAFCRPEYARHYFGDVGELSETPGEMAKFAWQKQMATGIITDSGDAETFFRNTIEAEISRMPPGNPVCRYDLMYLFYRNGYHFDPAMELGVNFLNWMPLQSSKLFEAKCLTTDAFRSARLELEMIHVNNPEMGAVEYESSRDSLDYGAIHDDLRSVIRTESELPDRSDEYTVANSKRGYSFTNRGEVLPDDLKERLMNRLSILARLDDGYYRERVVYSLAYYLLNNGDNISKLRAIYNKVLSITDQYTLLHCNESGMVDISNLNPYQGLD